MSASRISSESPASRASEQYSLPVSSFDFAIVPSAPRSAMRCAPFVVLGALVMYAVILVTALTGPNTSSESEAPTTMSGRTVAYVVPNALVVVG